MPITKADLFQVEGAPSGLPTGLLVAVWLDAAQAAQLAIPGGEPADQLHLTLCYCGDANAMSDVQIGRAIAACAEAGAMWGPLTGQIAGLGRFNASESSDDKDVLYANVDVPGLAELRHFLAASLEMAGCPPLRNHGYTPHITLAYIEAGADFPLERIETMPFVIRSIWVGVGDRRTEIMLNGDLDGKSIKGKDGKMTIYKSATIEVLDGKANGPWDILISTDRLDRDRDTINQLGWRVGDYMKNPVVMWSHDYHGYTPAGGVPIGKTHTLRVDTLGLIANFDFRQPANEHDFVSVIRSAWEQEVLRAASVGFQPVEWGDNESGGKGFKTQDLLEWSLTAIPANADALRRSYQLALKAAGMDALLDPDFVSITKRGRVLSSRNESRIRTAVDTLSAVLSELGEMPTTEDDAASARAADRPDKSPNATPVQKIQPPPNETNTDTPAPADIDNNNELTPKQEAELAQALAELSEELVDLI